MNIIDIAAYYNVIITKVDDWRLLLLFAIIADSHP